MNPDPWPELIRLAKVQGIDLTPARELVQSLRRTRVIDPTIAVGNTVLSYLRIGHSIEEAVEIARREATAALNE